MSRNDTDSIKTGIPMKSTIEERTRRRLMKVGRKNRILGFLMIPVLAVCMFVLRLWDYLCGNRKRFAMAVMSFFLFTVYSSFSFPVFISGDHTGLNNLDFEIQDENISLAKESELDLTTVEILEDSDVMDDPDSRPMAHGYTVTDTYGADEILQSNQGEGGQAVPDFGHAEQAQQGESDEAVFSKDDWRLILINKQHSIPEDYTFPLGTIQNNRKKMQCDARILDDLFAMLQAAKEDDINLSICSPYRDMEYQEMLFNRKIKRYMDRGMSYMEAFQLSSQVVTVPGASEHQIGLALDIVCDHYVTLDEGFGDTDAGKWLAENSYRFGFILRYPEGKEYITGIEYEPWHFRYVGVEAATVITQEGITLEEFWEDL
ncbi:MAG: M15 family metallopeptidase [Lachnospiraceae bacterium]|nr:M15 family metallopeptidase [Lachnospiraceae bacterium]